MVEGAMVSREKMSTMEILSNWIDERVVLPSPFLISSGGGRRGKLRRTRLQP